ncbi:type I toxin-antitoxin system Ibs family toxin [Escherichia coli]|nr:type I toxin-antitoxin system Ibs family toxin [Escherichia coli]
MMKCIIIVVLLVISFPAY